MRMKQREVEKREEKRREVEQKGREADQTSAVDTETKAAVSSDHTESRASLS
jgi:hypothetical protein